MPVIAMTQEMGSLAKDVAMHLAQTQNLAVMRHEVIEHLAEKMDMSKSVIRRLREGKAGFVDRLTADEEGMAIYTAEEVLGKRPSFLQGENTSSKTKQIIADKIRNFEPAEARLLNYRKDGKPYLCYVKIQAIRNQAGSYSHFLAIEKNVRERE